MVSAGDFRNGITFEMDGNVYSIIEFQHVKPGKGAAFVRTKIRKRDYRQRGGKDLQSQRQISHRLYRQKGYAVSVQRRRSVLFHGFGVL